MGNHPIRRSRTPGRISLSHMEADFIDKYRIVGTHGRAHIQQLVEWPTKSLYKQFLFICVRYKVQLSTAAASETRSVLDVSE